MGKNLVDRRRFIGLAAGSAGAALLFGQGRAFGAPGGTPGPPGGGGGGGGGTSTRNPLKLAPEVSPTTALTAAPTDFDLGGGKIGHGLGYNSSIPGPTFRARTDDPVSVLLTNGLDDHTTIHWHGMIVPEEADGHPKDAVLPGGTYLYQYRLVQRATMNWYHPHPHGMTGQQVVQGLAGLFIINDAEEGALGLPSGPYEIPLVIRDADLDSAGNLTYTDKRAGFLGKVPLLNGTLDAKLGVDRALYRFRILNGSSARIYRLTVSDGRPFTLIGNDGGLLPAPVGLAEIEIAPAERIDLLLNLRDIGTENLMLRDLNSGWDLLELVPTGASGGNGVQPTNLPLIEPLGSPVVTRDFSFDGMTRINGQTYDMNRISFQVPKGQTELWRFTTGGNAPHPVHIHGAYFQVQRRIGGRARVFPWEAGWKDTILLQDGETVEVLIRFDHYAGIYLMHCHQLGHEDGGMMLNFAVVDSPVPTALNAGGSGIFCDLT